jgi:hypothetical protein
MQWGLVLGVGAIVGTYLVLGLVTGGLLVGFQRETTAIKQRYSNVSQDERDAQFNNPAAALALPGNGTSRNSSPCGELEDDYDNDGLTRKEEAELDTDPCNPDDDGDGVADGVDTSPTDPREGGTRQPPKPEPREPNQFGQLSINRLDKFVKEPGSLSWGSYAAVNVNTPVNFRIEAELENVGTAEVTAVLEDILPSGLRFGSGTQDGIDGSSTLSSDWFEQKHYITISPSDTKEITLSFSAIPEYAGTFVNQVKVFDKDNPSITDTASAYVVAQEVTDNGGVFSFGILDKKVKERGGSTYRDSIITTKNTVLDFKISINVTNTHTETRNMILIDDLPNELRYLSGTGNGGELFTKGFITIPVDPGNQTYEYTFSATVISEATLTANIAKLYEAKFAPNGAIDRTQITIN